MKCRGIRDVSSLVVTWTFTDAGASPEPRRVPTAPKELMRGRPLSPRAARLRGAGGFPSPQKILSAVVGGIGQAIARRQGFGKVVVLANLNENTLNAPATGLKTTRYKVTTERNVLHVVNTAGLSPIMS